MKPSSDSGLVNISGTRRRFGRGSRASRRLGDSLGCDPFVELHKLIYEFHEFFLLEQVSEYRLHRLLEREAPAEVIRRLRELHAAHLELQKIERGVDLAELEDRLLSGLGMVQGRDKKGRPVVWCQTVRNIRDKDPSAAILHLYWIRLVAMQMRECEDVGILVLLDDRGRNTLDFSREYQKITARMDERIEAVLPKSNVVLLCSKSAKRAAELVLFATKKIAPLASERMAISVVSSTQQILDLLQDPTDVPQLFFPDTGKPFEPAFSTLGQYQQLLRRQALKAMKVGDWANPCKDRMAELRRACNNLTTHVSHEFPRSFGHSDIVLSDSSDHRVRGSWSPSIQRSFDHTGIRHDLETIAESSTDGVGW